MAEPLNFSGAKMQKKNKLIIIDGFKFTQNNVFSKKEFDAILKKAKEIESEPHDNKSYIDFKIDLCEYIENSNSSIKAGYGGHHIWIQKRDEIEIKNIAQINFDIFDYVVINKTNK